MAGMSWNFRSRRLTNMLRLKKLEWAYCSGAEVNKEGAVFSNDFSCSVSFNFSWKISLGGEKGRRSCGIWHVVQTFQGSHLVSQSQVIREGRQVSVKGKIWFYCLDFTIKILVIFSAKCNFLKMTRMCRKSYILQFFNFYLRVRVNNKK